MSKTESEVSTIEIEVPTHIAPDVQLLVEMLVKLETFIREPVDFNHLRAEHTLHEILGTVVQLAEQWRSQENT